MRLSKGKLPVTGVVSVYREILSSSRAAHRRAPIGVLQASAAQILLPARWRFGACDTFLSHKTWLEVAKGLKKGSLELALLTGQDLADILGTPKGQASFFGHFDVVADFPSNLEGATPLAQRIFIVTKRGKGASCVASHILILIECKSTVNAVKTLLHSMPDRRTHAEQLLIGSRSARSGKMALVRLSLPEPLEGIRATELLLSARKSSGFEASILGVYPGTENYGG